jgi:hypothetical protein
VESTELDLLFAVQLFPYCKQPFFTSFFFPFDDGVFVKKKVMQCILSFMSELSFLCFLALRIKKDVFASRRAASQACSDFVGAHLSDIWRA